MSNINANVVVESTTLTITDTQLSLTSTVDPINLGIYTSQAPTSIPAGNVGQLQYNLNGVLFAGLANSNIDANGNLVFTNLSNLKILGGSANYQLTTDGTGNLTWTDSITNANFANYAGNVTISSQPNITSVGTLTSLDVQGLANLGSESNLIITGGVNGYVLGTNGAGNLSWVAQGGAGNGNPGGATGQIQFNDLNLFAGNAGFTFDKVSGDVDIPGNLVVVGNIDSSAGNLNIVGNIDSSAGIFNGDGGGLSNVTADTVSVAAQPNITSVGTLTSVNVSGNATIDGTIFVYEAIENVSLIGAQSGTYNYDLLNGAIQYATADATANVTLNFRGSSLVSLDTMLGNGQSIIGTYIMTTGTNAYGIAGVQIDGVAQVIDWAGGGAPAYLSNTKQSYTFTCIKTSTVPTYTVFGSMTRYG